MVTPSRRRGVVDHLRTAWRVSERRACRATGFHRSTQRYRPRRDPQAELRMRLRELAAARVRYGYRRLHVLLRREGWPVNAKRIHRLYREEGLSIRPRTPRRRRSCRYRSERSLAAGPNDCWAMDFVSDALFDGRPFRILAVIDCHTREALAIVPRTGFRAFQVVEVLDRLAAERGRPRTIRVDTSAAKPPAPRVRRQDAGPVGLPERGRAGLLAARQARRQRPYRGVQRSLPAGMPKRVLVPVAGRRKGLVSSQ